MASDLRFSYSGLYLRPHKTSTSGQKGSRLCMEGANGIRFPGKKNRGHTASDLGFSYLSLYQDSLSNVPGTFKFSPEGAFGISIRLLEAGLHFGGQPISRRLLILGPSNSAQRALLGLVLDCQKLASISQVERQNSLVAPFWRSANF